MVTRVGPCDNPTMAGTRVSRVEQLLGWFADGKLSRKKLVAELRTMTQGVDEVSHRPGAEDNRPTGGLDARIDELIDQINKLVAQKH